MPKRICDQPESRDYDYEITRHNLSVHSSAARATAENLGQELSYALGVIASLANRLSEVEKSLSTLESKENRSA